MGFGAGVQLVRVDQHHAAGRRQMIAAAMTKALRTMFNHGKDKPFMHMRGKALLNIMRLQQLYPAQLA